MRVSQVHSRRKGALAVLALCAACAPPERPGTQPERVLLVTIEALRADHCSALGYARETTFVQRLGDERALDIDRMAETGVLFAQAFAPSPLAERSLRALLAIEQAGAESALARVLGATGFATAAVLVPSSAVDATQLGRGFQSVMLFSAGEGESEPEARAVVAARDWLAARAAKGERAFLWFHLGRPAPPFESAALSDEYTQGARELDLYDGELAATNATVLELLESFAKLDPAHLPNTLVAIAGVNGLHLQHEGDAALDEQQLHVPLVLRHPPSLTGRRILDEVVELADLAPTLFDWFGVDAPEGLPGRSLLPLVDSYVERPFDARGALAIADDAASLRDPRYRLVLEAGSPARLYDAWNDPLQARDLCAELPDRCRAMEAELRARLEAAGEGDW